MIVKVCGIKSEENIRDLSEVNIDMVGLNFYPKSKRYVDHSVIPQWYDYFGDSVSRVGVFVNCDLEDVEDFIDEYRLDYAQLHGDEDLEYCKQLSETISIIKAVRLEDESDFEGLEAYHFVDYLLFDTKTVLYGGSGKKFNWDSLEFYKGDKPFLLSGGIGPDDVQAIRDIDHPQFKGIDLNSKFEASSGLKDIQLIEAFLTNLDS